MCRVRIAANIPWYMFQVPEYRTFLQKCCRQQIPNKFTLTKNYLYLCYQDALSSVQHYIGNYHISITVNETTDVTGYYIVNLVGILDAEEPFLICLKMERINHETVACFVNNGLKVLWLDDIPEEKVLVLYSDADSYTLKAATALRVFYSNIIHLSCLAHGLQRITEEV
ncbi:hypothetical protein PR048_018762 [Dryococelus australis]|uniref:DUF659 domain-containing protein n=1 Tax=Dryococelus australis TaxID=614101 RepID=A0ABQ9HDE2_9NEOP|nr:hypothetical protein PR048_018762 [Dryococelus australis]